MASTVKGLEKVIAELRNYGPKAEQFLKDELEGVGRDIEADAKVLASGIQGAPPELKQRISNEVINGGLGTRVTQNFLPMGAYIEFGTGAFVVVAPEWKEMAWKFYVNGKGTLRAHPYMYPAYIQNRKLFLERLKKGLKVIFEK